VSTELSATDGTAISTEGAPQQTGLQKKALVIVGFVLAGLWAIAIPSGSLVFQIIVGVLTAVVAGFLVWAVRMIRKQQSLAGMLQGAIKSPEARREALAKLEAAKDPNDVTNIFARAQLLAADEPDRALELLEAVERKRIPAQMQDDFGLLQSQLYLMAGKPREARPLVDLINVDSPQRKEQRAFVVAVVAEAWARTGKHTEALELLGTVETGKENAEIRAQLLVGDVFGRFASGKRKEARESLEKLAAIEPNYLGKFILPRFRVHPQLQTLARSVAEKQPGLRRAASGGRPHLPGGGLRR
jgi:tetratricopeptide (TPR) repeat protein